MTQAEVVDFIANGRSISGVSVQTADEAAVVRLYAGAVVLTAGAWSQRLFDNLSLRSSP